MSIDGISNAAPLRNIYFGNTQKAEGTKVDLTLPPDTVELSTKKAMAKKEKPSLLQRFGLGVASAFCPGLGQLINGSPIKAGLFFTGTIAAGVAGMMLLGPIGALAGSAVGLASVIEAAVNAK